MNNLRTFVGKYAPNHKEFGQWVDTTADPNGSVTKVYRNGKWISEAGMQSEDSLTKAQVIDLITGSCKGLQQQIDNVLDKLNYLSRELKRLRRGTAIVESQTESMNSNII